MKTFTLENNHLNITLSNFGASWLSCIVKHPKGDREVLITTTPKRWAEQSAYFGATVGRYANRIANGEYELNGKVYQLAKNNGDNNLHGGLKGANAVEWQVLEQSPQAVKFGYIFADGEEGFGGEVKATVTYRLTDNQLEVNFDALSDQATPLCLTNHAYFNLDSSTTIHHHSLQLNASHYLPVGEDGIPNGLLKAVDSTSFDFRQPKAIGEDLLADTDQRVVRGYDHAFLIAKENQNFTACLSVEDLQLRLETSMPAVQLYTGNWLAGQPRGESGVCEDYAGVALEPEFFPDSPNHPELAAFGGISQANEPYHHSVYYRFVY